jgi:hypothetical protein
MKIKIVKKPYWQNKQTKQIVSFFGSVPFYNSTEQTKWEKKYKEVKEVTDCFGNVTYQNV